MRRGLTQPLQSGDRPRTYVADAGFVDQTRGRGGRKGRIDETLTPHPDARSAGALPAITAVTAVAMGGATSAPRGPRRSTRLPAARRRQGDDERREARLRLRLPHRLHPGRRPAARRRRPGRRAVDPRRNLRPDGEGDGRRQRPLAGREAARVAQQALAELQGQRAAQVGDDGRIPDLRRQQRLQPTTTTRTRSARRACATRCRAGRRRRRGRAASPAARSGSPRTASRSSTRSTPKTATRSPTRRRTTAAAIRSGSASTTTTTIPSCLTKGELEEPRLRPGRLGARRLPDLRPARPRRQAADERRPRRLPRPDQQGLLRRPLAAHLPLQRHARVPLHARLLPRHAPGVATSASGAPFPPQR